MRKAKELKEGYIHKLPDKEEYPSVVSKRQQEMWFHIPLWKWSSSNQILLTPEEQSYHRAVVPQSGSNAMPRIKNIFLVEIYVMKLTIIIRMSNTAHVSAFFCKLKTFQAALICLVFLISAEYTIIIITACSSWKFRTGILWEIHSVLVWEQRPVFIPE